MDERPLFGAGSAPARRPAEKRVRPRSQNLGREARGTMNPAGYAPQPPAGHIQAPTAPLSVAQTPAGPPPVDPNMAVPTLPPPPLVSPQPAASGPETAPLAAPPGTGDMRQTAYPQPVPQPPEHPVAPPPSAGQQPYMPPMAQPCAPVYSAATPPQQNPAPGPGTVNPSGNVMPGQPGIAPTPFLAPPVPTSPHVGGEAVQPVPAQMHPQTIPANPDAPPVAAEMAAAPIQDVAEHVPTPPARQVQPVAAPLQQIPVQGHRAPVADYPVQPANSFAPQGPQTAQPPGAPPVAPAPPQYVQNSQAAGLVQQQHYNPGAPIPPTQVAAPQAPQTLQPNGTVEDRKSPRLRALKGGMIVLPGQMMSSFKCKIRNESRGGVMITLTNAAEVPDEFYLVRDSDPGNRVPCRVAWRAHDRLGAMFVPALTGL